jgi:hypothetical protein
MYVILSPVLSGGEGAVKNLWTKRLDASRSLFLHLAQDRFNPPLRGELGWGIIPPPLILPHKGGGKI